MDLTEDQARALVADIEARAAEYAKDAAKGAAAGYHPEIGPSMSVQEMERQWQSGNSRSNYEAWLYGIARKDLQGVRWEVHEGINHSELVIRL